MRKQANSEAEQKIKLKKEMQILEKFMEDIMAVFRLTEEKLDFNKKVLSEREQANKNTRIFLKSGNASSRTWYEQTRKTSKIVKRRSTGLTILTLNFTNSLQKRIKSFQKNTSVSKREIK